MHSVLSSLSCEKTTFDLSLAIATTQQGRATSAQLAWPMLED